MVESPRSHLAYREALQKELGRLPPELLEAWLRETKRRTVSLEEVKAAKLRSERAARHLNPPLLPGRWAPASKLIIIAATNRYLAAGAALSSPCTNLLELAQRDRVVELIRGPLRHLGGPRKILIFRSVKTFIERILKHRADHLDTVMLNIRANELALDYSGKLKDYAEYRDAALGLEPFMGPEEPHDLTSAIMTREKAIANIAVSIDPRLGEIGGLLLEDVVIDGKHVTIVIAAEISKQRRPQSRALDSECAVPVLEYVLRARPFLSSMRPVGLTEPSELWLTRTGSPLVQQGVAQALTRVLSHSMGVPVGAKILRKVMASREDLADAEVGAALGHALGSLLGIDLYNVHDQAKALRVSVAKWNEIDGRSGPFANAWPTTLPRCEEGWTHGSRSMTEGRE